MDKETAETIQQVHRLFKERHLTLSVAESCTGGLVSHYLTSLPGASEFFEAGLVTYSYEAKRRILDIPAGELEKYGAISEETARKMAEQARTLTGTDYGLATTGNLGPGVLEGRERGLVYIAAGTDESVIARRLVLSEERGPNKKRAALEALKLLIELAGDFNTI